MIIKLAVLLAAVFVVAKQVGDEIKFRAQEKEWKEQSFEYNGFRLNKDYFKLVDGKIIQKG